MDIDIAEMLFCAALLAIAPNVLVAAIDSLWNRRGLRWELPRSWLRLH